MPRILHPTAWLLSVLLLIGQPAAFAAEKRAAAAPARDAQWVNQVFQAGKAHYESGDYASAMREWTKLDPYLDQYPSFKKVIGYLKSQILTGPGTAAASSASPEITPEVSEATLAAKESLGTFREAEGRLQDDLKQSLSDRKQLQSTSSEKESWIRTTLRKGQVAYENGDWEVAFSEWDKVQPMLDPTSREAAQLVKLRKSYEMVQIARKQNDDLMRQKKADLKIPEDLSKMLETARKELEQEVIGLQNRQESIEKDAIFEQAWINTTFEKGQAAYQAGNYDLAVEEWDKLIFKLKGQPELIAQIEQFKNTVRSHKEAQLLFSKASGDLTTQTHPQSEEMQRFLKQVSSEMKAKAETLSRQSGERQQSIADQQQRVNETFERGKQLYLAGKHKDALGEWLLLSSYFEGDPTLKAAFLSAQGSLKAHEQASLTYQSALEAGSYRVQLPDGFFRFVENANHELAEKTRMAEGERQKTEMAVASKRADMMKAFEQGKSWYAEGRIGDAIGEWKKIAPWIENSEDYQAELQKLEANYQEATHQAQSLKEVRTKAGGNYSPPAELAQILVSANQDLKDQAQAATNERMVLQQNYNDRQSKISNILYKADLALKAGKTAQAVAEWEKLLVYMDPAAEETALIESVKQSYDEYSKAIQQRREVTAQSAPAAALPSELKAALTKTNEQLIKDASQARMESEAQLASLKDRQTLVTSAVEKGKLFYQAGRLEQALAEWEKLFPYLDKASEERLLIESLKQNLLDSKEAERQKQAVVSTRESGLQLPEDLKKILADATQGLIAKAESARAEREAIEKTRSDRQTEMFAALERARVYTQAGRIGEALEEWKKLTVHMEENAEARSLIKELDGSFRQYQLAKQSYEEALPLKDAKFPAPDGLKGLISEGQEKLSRETQTIQLSKAKMEEETAARKAFVEKAFASGKALAADGKWLEAIYEWEKLIPYLEPNDPLGTMLGEVKKAWNLLQETKKSNEIFIATQYKDVKLPFTAEIEKSLIELDGILRKDLDAAREARAGMERSLTERQAWVQSTFEKGKAYYEVGKYKEAIDFWVSLQPQLKSEAKAQALLSSLPQRYQELVAAQEAVKSAEAAKDAPLDAPSELETLVLEMGGKIGLQHNEAMTLQARASQEADARQAAMNALFAQGEKAYQEGRLGDAIHSWSGLPEYLKDPAKVKASIDALAASYDNFVKTQQAVREAEARLAGKLGAPEGLAALLSEASLRLDKQRQESLLSKERTDKVHAEKKAAVDKLFADGKALFDQGKLPDAFAAWRSMLPSINDEGGLGASLDKADESYQLYLVAKNQNQDSLSRKEAKLAAPEELSMILETANTKLRDDIFDYKSRTLQTQKMLEDRKSWIGVTYEKGKLAYSQGRYQDAAAEWKTLLPFIENGAQFEKLLADFERNMGVSLEASKINQEAELKKNAKFSAPDELGVLLLELNEKVKSQALEAQTAKIRSEQQFSERREWVRTTFETGRDLYHQGKFEDAISEWEKLAPYLEAGESTQKLIAAVKQNLSASQDAKQAAVAAAAQDYQGLQMPYADEMTRLLKQADEKLSAEAKEYSSKKIDLEKAMAERQEWSVNTFNKGKVLYDQGRYDEALGQWERLLPYLADASPIKSLIKAIRESHTTIVAGKNALGEAGGSEPPVRLSNEEEFLGVLEEAARKFRTDTEALDQQKRQIEKSLEQRKEWIQFTFEKGKAFYDQGNYAKAIEEWGVLGPYLGEHPAVREKIEAAKKAYTEGRYAKQLIESLEAKKSSLLGLPEPKAAQPVAAAEPPASQPADEIEAIETSEPVVIERTDASENASTEMAEEPAGVELVTGELESVDEGSRTLTLRVISDTGESQSLTVSFNEATQMGGSRAKSVASIPSGTEIDVRYNPQTSQALYVYVY